MNKTSFVNEMTTTKNVDNPSKDAGILDTFSVEGPNYIG